MWSGRAHIVLGMGMLFFWHVAPASACIRPPCSGTGQTKDTNVEMAGGNMAHPDGMAPEPDYEKVIAAELEGSVREGTRSALIRFIARHADHPLADRARAMLANGSAGGTGGGDGPDAAIYAEFDAALQEGTGSALRAFIGRHPEHPLAAEARRLLAK